IAFVGYGALVVAAARLSLVFPAAAIERPLAWRQAWSVMAGNYWRLFACMLGCYVPFGLVHYILEKIDEAGPLWILFEAIGVAVSFAGAAVVAALLSEVYRGFYPVETSA